MFIIFEIEQVQQTQTVDVLAGLFGEGKAPFDVRRTDNMCRLPLLQAVK